VQLYRKPQVVVQTYAEAYRNGPENPDLVEKTPSRGNAVCNGYA